MKIELTDGSREVEIGGYTFTCDVTDLESLNALEAYEAKREAGEFDDTDLMLEESKKTMDTVFGSGSYDKIFGDTRTIKPLKVLIQVLDLFRSEVFKEEREKQEAEEKEAEEYIEKQTKLIKQMNEQVNYFNRAYGGMVNGRRASKKHNNRKR